MTTIGIYAEEYNEIGSATILEGIDGFHQEIEDTEINIIGKAEEGTVISVYIQKKTYWNDKINDRIIDDFSLKVGAYGIFDFNINFEGIGEYTVYIMTDDKGAPFKEYKIIVNDNEMFTDLEKVDYVFNRSSFFVD